MRIFTKNNVIRGFTVGKIFWVIGSIYRTLSELEFFQRKMPSKNYTSFLGPTVWDLVDPEVRDFNLVNSFKHGITEKYSDRKRSPFVFFHHEFLNFLFSTTRGGIMETRSI